VADRPHEPDAQDLPEAVAVPKRRFTPQLIWIIPIVAVLVGGWLAAKAILERGPTITITFKTAEGLEAGKTKIKYKDVEIGVVKTIALSSDRKGIVVKAEISKQSEEFLREDTRFFVVRPRVTAGGVSGLSTLLSGGYIGMDIGKSRETRRDFVGLEVAPIVTGEEPGRQFVLRADDLGSTDVGTPIYFRRVTVGQVVATALDKDGKGVTFTIFIQAPYDQYVTKNTRFWNASGIDVSLDATGIQLRTESVVSILVGGIAFQVEPDSLPEPPADANTVFTLFPDRTQAFKRADTIIDTYMLVFDGSVRGLSVGAPLDFRGVTIGEVVRIGVSIDPATFVFRMPVEVKLFPRNQLGTIASQIEGTQLGTIEAFTSPADFFAGVDPRFGTFSIPVLFKDMAHAEKVLLDPALNKEILGLGADKNVQVVSIYTFAFAHYLAKQPIRRIDDFKVMVRPLKAVNLLHRQMGAMLEQLSGTSR